MKKEFEKWNQKKMHINGAQVVPHFHEREIWFCFLGANVGFEQDGRGEDFQRPVVIIKKFNNEIGWVVPLSRTDKQGKYYYGFSLGERGMSTALLSQIKLLDVHRLSRKIGVIDEKHFRELIEKLKGLFP